MNKAPAFEDWERRADAVEHADPVWRMIAYRIAIYALENAWIDAVALDARRVTRAIAGQLYRAVGSISANIAEGYGRSSGPDRARFYEYGLSSTRESVVWYRAARPVLGPVVTANRFESLTRIRQLLLATIPRERTKRVRPRRDEE